MMMASSGHFSLPPQTTQSFSEACFDSNSATICVGLCTFVVTGRIAPNTSHNGSELIIVFLCDPFPQNFLLMQMAMAGWNWINANCWLVHCPPAVCQSITASLSHLLCSSNHLISRTVNTPSALKHTAPLILIPRQIPTMHLVYRSWVLLRSASPILSHQMGRTLVTASCRAASQMAVSRRDLADTWMGCCLRLPTTTARQTSLL